MNLDHINAFNHKIQKDLEIKKPQKFVFKWRGGENEEGKKMFSNGRNESSLLIPPISLIPHI